MFIEKKLKRIDNLYEFLVISFSTTFIDSLFLYFVQWVCSTFQSDCYNGNGCLEKLRVCSHKSQCLEPDDCGKSGVNCNLVNRLISMFWCFISLEAESEYFPYFIGFQSTSPCLLIVWYFKQLWFSR